MASLLSAMRQWSMLLLLGLGPATLVAGKSAADYFVTDLPGVPEDAEPIKMHAGHIEVTEEHNGNLFFWHFQNQHIANKQRTVIWINGGPGCSSEDGALMEVGPYRVNEDGTLRLNEGSWNEFANLLFVDNPVGTGFSYVDTDSYIHELDEMADNFVTFLEKFFEMFPHFAQDDIYIAGESYAGQHIPYIARGILDRNKKEQDAWNLAGLLIGNGWISPYDQYDSYTKFARQKGLLEKGSSNDKKLEEMLKTCHKVVSDKPGHVDYGECEDILSKLLEYLKEGDGDNACINMYDVRMRDSYPSCGMNWPPDLKQMTPYLRKKEVLQALHVNEQRNAGWQECNGAVSSSFRAQKSKPAIELLPDLIAEVPTLLFSGAEDLICNHIGTEDMINGMEWNGGKGFETSAGNWAPRRNWTFEGDDAGFWQEARNLTYVLFNDASHMVPFDYPRRSRDMLDRFMGIDVSSIGGKPVDSLIDGEKGPDTAVGDSDGSNADEDSDEVQKAKWQAYRRSGGVVLVIVIIAASAWGYFVWSERRKRAAYHSIDGEPSTLEGFRRKPGDGDLEAAAFDDGELDDLHTDTPSGHNGSKYSIGDDSDDEQGGKSTIAKESGRA
ncbi:Carboxypeptidase [Emericellopsis cladophorae]|uniref:Carboxypeptidase n=1 Tax=Emericellopsis cladophorae TaxID=2686198 RepID=A0A9Q0BH48_9HYPO|nr:Carboxypeptidase [Emericellopsis cladophorae]KAI6784370.1 Carboxypeptidase [Emericellopsis cladophorae]